MAWSKRSLRSGTDKYGEAAHSPPCIRKATETVAALHNLTHTRGKHIMSNYAGGPFYRADDGAVLRRTDGKPEAAARASTRSRSRTSSATTPPPATTTCSATSQSAREGERLGRKDSDERNGGRRGLAAKRAPRRPGSAPAPGLRAGSTAAQWHRIPQRRFG
jgi:hypothetical protein